MRRLTLAAGLALLPLMAQASSTPEPIKGANDTRLRTIDYSPNAVVTLTSTNGTPITLTFGLGQKPQMVVGTTVYPIETDDKDDAEKKAAKVAACSHHLSDSQSVPVWCASWHANELSIQPLREDSDGSTVSISTADDKGIWYHYQFILMTRSGKIGGTHPCASADEKGCYDADAYFHVTWTNHTEEAKERRDALKPSQALAQQGKVQDRLYTSGSRMPRIYEWDQFGKDCPELAPATAFDDGSRVYLHFRMNTPLSIPSYPTPGGEAKLDYKSTPASSDSGLDWTFTFVPQTIYLRKLDGTEQKVCGLRKRRDVSKDGVPYTGTSSPDVVRAVR